MDWNSIFDYCPETGVLTWKIDRGTRARVGMVAGTLLPKGYLKVKFGLRNYRVHRVVWEMVNGPIPEGMEIDHINHDRADNRIENLRLVTGDLNMMNKSRYKVNSSGVTGVSFVRKERKWYAYINIGGVRIPLYRGQYFSEAVSARKAAEVEYGFHKNHGL